MESRFNSLAPHQNDGQNNWMRRLCPLTVKESPSHTESPISPPLPTSSCFSFVSLSIMSSPHISPTSPTSSCICISPLSSSAMPNSLSEKHVPFDTQGLNDNIRWTFVRHLKAHQYHHRRRYAGLLLSFVRRMRASCTSLSISAMSVPPAMSWMSSMSSSASSSSSSRRLSGTAPVVL